MNTDVIDKAFSEMIAKRGVHNQLKIKPGYAQQLRYKLSNNIGISTDTKLRLLQKTGWRQDNRTFTQADLVNCVKYALKKSATAKEFGAEYIVEQFLKPKK